MHIVVGVPGVLAALTLVYNTSRFGGLAYYSSGQTVAVYYGGNKVLPLRSRNMYVGF